MMYYVADSLDTVDADYDFLKEERRTVNRQAEDVYGHELFPVAPYDGILISRAKIEGRHSRFSPGQRYRLMRSGIHAFLRVSPDFPTMIDCGSYSHLGEEIPPYDPEDSVRFYSQCGCNAGVSPDCVILELDSRWDDPRRTPTSILARAQSTQAAALQFLTACRNAAVPFEPIGVVQSWSPRSAARYAKVLIEAGYTWLGLGGLAHRRTREIYDVLCEVRSAIPESTRVHLFGFNRVDQLEAFTGLGVSSIDSAAPLLKAVKDDRHNYFAADGDHYLAIKIPAKHQNRIHGRISSGVMEAGMYTALEERAMRAFRECALGQIPIEAALNELQAYHDFAFEGDEFPSSAYLRVLRDRPWDKCNCAVCSDIGPDVMLLRGINRNKRRGFHNSYVFHRRVRDVMSNKGLQFPAIRFRQSDGSELFQFVAQAKDIARFTTVSRLKRGDDGALTGYQRPEVDYHIQEIGEYLDRSDSILPNAIIVSLSSSPAFEPLQDHGDYGELGTLTVPVDEHGTKALIVDGQQRAAAFRRLAKPSFPVPVLAFVAAGKDAELGQFLLVNNVKPLPKSLIHELLPALGKAVPKRLSSRQKACAVVEQLSTSAESPFQNRIRTMTTRHLTSANISDTAVIQMVEHSMANGILFSLSGRREVGVTQVKRFYEAVTVVYPEAWMLPPRRSRLTHGAGIVALGYLMDTVFDLLMEDGALPTVKQYAQELRRLGELPWTAGVWRFSSDTILPWNEIQNTPRHRELVSNYIVRSYLAARAKVVPIPRDAATGS